MSTNAQPDSETIAEIRALAKLPKGWDSYNGDVADEGAVKSAISLVTAMYGKNPHAPRPEVGLVSDGSVVLRWTLPTREFELTYRTFETGDYVVSQRPDGLVLVEGSLNNVFDPLKELISVYVAPAS